MVRTGMVVWWGVVGACTSPADLPSGSTGTAPTPRAGGWSQGPPLLAPLQEHSVVALRGEVVVLGGYDDQRRIVDRVEAFDPVAERWRSLAPLPEPSHHVNAVVVGDQIVVLGVLQGGFLEEAVHWVYDPDTNAWTDRVRAPDSHIVGASVVGVAGYEIHLVGGLRSIRAVALHSVFDTAERVWRTMPDSPRPRDHAAGGVAHGALVVVGGREATISSVVDAVDRLDLGELQWASGEPMPTARAGVAHAIDPRGRLHVVGGEGNPLDADGVFADHEVYDVERDEWTVLAPMPRPRHGMGAVFVDGVLYVPGGAPVQAFGATSALDIYTPDLTR